jgi:type IV secretion system protein VirB2
MERIRNFCILVFVLCPLSAYASSTDMPWESKLDKILASIQGPVLKVVGAVLIIGCGIGLAVGERGSTLNKLFGLVMGLSIAATASSFFLGFFNIGGICF